jgi:hypothetical protein
MTVALKWRRCFDVAAAIVAMSAAIAVIVLASGASVRAQPAAPAGAPGAGGETQKDCDKTPTAADAASKASSQRSWQMVGRDLDLTLSSSKVTDKSRFVVCFRWRAKSGKPEVEQAEPVRIVQRSSSAQPAPGEAPGKAGANQPPPTVSLTARVPSFDKWPSRDAVFYTDDNSAPLADVRILVFDGTTPIDEATTPLAVVQPNDYCNVPRLGTRIDSGTIEPSASKAWQPVGGEIQFAVKSSKVFPSDALIHACFRWKLNQGDPGPFKESGPIRVLEWQSTQPSTVKLGVTISDIGEEPNRVTGDRVGAFAIPYLLVPRTDVRVLFFDANLNLILDAWTWAGVTSVFFAAVIALAAVGIVFVGLWQVSRRRFPTFGKTNPLLALIMTRSGFASLSQFQIMLWTFVVIASAAYVIALSGDLIPITAGTLVLLGISGTATVISKVKSERDAAAPPPLDPAAASAEATRAQKDLDEAQLAAAGASADTQDDANKAVEEAAAKLVVAKAKVEAADAVAAAAKAREAVANATDKDKAQSDARTAEENALEKKKALARAETEAAAKTRIRHPRWSDLVMEEVQGREVDVTRVQMLYFTLVTAVFVALKVITSYEIPAIPEGFLILMGISNSVYVGSKFATNPAAK